MISVDVYSFASNTIAKLAKLRSGHYPLVQSFMHDVHNEKYIAYATALSISVCVTKYPGYLRHMSRCSLGEICWPCSATKTFNGMR